MTTETQDALTAIVAALVCLTGLGLGLGILTALLRAGLDTLRP